MKQRSARHILLTLVFLGCSLGCTGSSTVQMNGTPPQNTNQAFSPEQQNQNSQIGNPSFQQSPPNGQQSAGQGQGNLGSGAAGPDPTQQQPTDTLSDIPDEREQGEASSDAASPDDEEEATEDEVGTCQCATKVKGCTEVVFFGKQCQDDEGTADYPSVTKAACTEQFCREQTQKEGEAGCAEDNMCDTKSFTLQIFKAEPTWLPKK